MENGKDKKVKNYTSVILKDSLILKLKDVMGDIGIKTSYTSLIEFLVNHYERNK